MSAGTPAQPGTPPANNPAASDVRSKKFGLTTSPDASTLGRGPGDESRPEPEDGAEYVPV